MVVKAKVVEKYENSEYTDKELRELGKLWMRWDAKSELRRVRWEYDWTFPLHVCSLNLGYHGKCLIMTERRLVASTAAIAGDNLECQADTSTIWNLPEHGIKIYTMSAQLPFEVSSLWLCVARDWAKLLHETFSENCNEVHRYEFRQTNHSKLYRTYLQHYWYSMHICKIPVRQSSRRDL